MISHRDPGKKYTVLYLSLVIGTFDYDASNAKSLFS